MDLKIFSQPSFWKCSIFPRIIPPNISPFFSFYKLYNSYNLFSANRAFPLSVVLLISKNFNLNCHALLVILFTTDAAVCHKISIIWFNIILKVGFRTDTIYVKKTKKYIYSDKIVYWSLEIVKNFVTARKLVRVH